MIKERTIELLAGLVIEDCLVKITQELSKEEYKDLNNALVRIGSKWNKKLGGHLFSSDPTDLISYLIVTKTLPKKNPTAFFPTKDDLIDIMMDEAGVMWQGELYQNESPLKLLEPSAGSGAIANRMREAFPNAFIDTVEFLPSNQKKLREQGFKPMCIDFLEFNKDYEHKFDYCFMNPPFSYEKHPKAYIEHINHAYEMLEENGVLIGIAPTGFIRGKTAMEKKFYDLVASGLSMTIIDEGFDDTKVQTVIFKIQKKTDMPFNDYTNFVSYSLLLNIMNDQKHNDKLIKLFEGFGIEEGDFDKKATEELVVSIIEELKKDEVHFPISSYMDNYIQDLKRWFRIDYCVEVEKEYLLKIVSGATHLVDEKKLVSVANLIVKKVNNNDAAIVTHQQAFDYINGSDVGYECRVAS